MSSAVLIAPIAYHRLTFERGEKEHIVDFATRCAVAGLALLSLSMTASVLLVVSYLFGRTAAIAAAAFVGAVFAWLWFGFGWWRRRTRPDRRPDA